MQSLKKIHAGAQMKVPLTTFLIYVYHASIQGRGSWGPDHSPGKSQSFMLPYNYWSAPRGQSQSNQASIQCWSINSPSETHYFRQEISYITTKERSTVIFQDCQAFMEIKRDAGISHILLVIGILYM